MDEDNLNDLLSLKNTTPKPKQKKLRIPKIDPNKNPNGFFDIADFILNIKKNEVCNMTLDELLDKISQEGMDSLS